MTTITETTTGISTDPRTATAARRHRRAPVLAAAAFAAVSAAAGTARAQSYQPISLTGWNADLVVESGGTAGSATPLDLPNGYSFYQAGVASTGGLPSTGTINSVANPSTVFQLQSYTANNALFFNTQTSYNNAGTVSTFSTNTTGLLTLATPKAFTSLAFLDNAANASANTSFSYQFNYADGTNTSGSFTALDWYNNAGYAIGGLGRINPTTLAADTSGVSATNPRMYEADVSVPQPTKLLKSIQILNFNTPNVSGSQGAIYAVSGLNTPNTNVWAGTVSNVWDTSTPNFTGNTSGGAVFGNGNLAVFDDTAATANVAVQAAGVQPYQTLLNNNTLAYTFSGGGINAGTVAVSGTAPVTFANVDAYTGATTISGGSAVTVAAGGGLNGTSAVNVSNGSLSIAAGGTVYANGAVNLSGGTLTVAAGGKMNLSGNLYVGPTSTFNLTGSVVNTTTAASTFNVSGTTNINAGGSLYANGPLTTQVATNGHLNIVAGGTLASNGSYNYLYIQPGGSMNLSGTYSYNSYGYNYIGTAAATGLPANLEVANGGVLNNSSYSYTYVYNGSNFTVDPGGTFSTSYSYNYVYLYGNSFNLNGNWKIGSTTTTPANTYGVVYLYNTTAGTSAATPGNAGTFEVGPNATVPQLYLYYSSYNGSTYLNNASDRLYYLYGTSGSSHLYLNGSSGTALTIGNGVAANAGSYNGSISGLGSVNIDTGSSYVTLTGNNTYTGGTTFSSGYVNAFTAVYNTSSPQSYLITPTPAALQGPYTFNGGGIGIQNTNTSGAVAFPYPVTFGATPGITIAGQGQVSINQPVTLPPNATTTFTLTTVTATSNTSAYLYANNPVTLSFGSTITGSPTSILNISGGALGGYFNLNFPLSIGGLAASGSTLNVTAAQTLSGDVLATENPYNTAAGTINLNAGSSFRNLTATGGTVNVNAGQTLSGNLSTGVTTGNAGGVINVNSGGSTIAGNVVANGGTVNLNASSSFANLIATGGTVNVNAVQTYAGQTNASGGTIVVNSLSYIAGTSALIAGANNGSAGTLVLADPNVSTYGFVGGGSSGTPLPLTIAGGVLQVGTAGQTVTYAAPITVGVGGGTIEAGVGGTLTLTAPITSTDGVGPVGLAAALTTGSPFPYINLAAPNSYAGETRITSPGNTSNFLQVQQQVAGAISPNAGVTFVGGGEILLDLNGFDTAVSYLSGGSGSTQLVEDNSGRATTLTIGNAAVPATSVKTFGGTLATNLSLVKVGAGNQVLTNRNTYAGTTSINAGTLTAANPQALSTGTVNLGGGTLALSGGGGNLTGFSAFSFNGGASAPNNVLILTDGATGETRSAFSTTPANFTATSNFTASFLFSSARPLAGGNQADGITFTIEGDSKGNAAIGGGGGGLAYGSGDAGTAIANSAALQFNIYSYTGSGIGFGTNGTINDSNSAGTNISLTGDDPLQVTVTYNGSAHVLTETIHDNTLGGTSTFNYPVNLPSVLGGNVGYVGFTGSTGGSASFQNVSNFTFDNGNLAGPLSIANPIVATANTSSVITTSVSSGFNQVAISSLTLNAGSKVSLQATAISAGSKLVTTIGSSNLSFSGTPTAPTSQLDLVTGDLVVTGGNLADLTALVAAGYANGTLNGPGIVSSAARANAARNTTVGVILNVDPSAGQLYGSGTALGLFDGSNPGSNDVLVKYAYFGDANLDGKVDGADYAQIDAGFLGGGSLTGWYNGDFNYDGKVDASDYTLIDNAFNTQAASLRSSVAAAGSGITAASTDEVAPAAGTAAVPEPATVGLLAVAAGGLLARRRRV